MPLIFLIISQRTFIFLSGIIGNVVSLCIINSCPLLVPMVLWCFQAAMDLFQLLQSFVVEFVARHGALLQALWLDEITLKAMGGGVLHR